ncbi:MAG: AsmA-like C-terminal region-containing protein [Acuticoccus sp.]
MNWIVITLGTALVLALFTALVGPYFVDWTAYRGVFEANAERMLGARVTIDGEAELRLLPSPRMRLTDVRLGETSHPLLAAETVELDVELTPLLRGELRVSELRLDAPVVRLTIADNGRLEMPDMAADTALTALFNVDDIAVDDIALSGGTLAITDRRTGTERTVTDIALAGRAQSLRGPFNASGTLRVDGKPHDLQFGAGALEADTMPLSARLAPTDGGVSLAFEGAMVPRVDAPALRGELTVVATGRPAWSLRGEVRASTQALTLSRGTARYGTGDAALEFTATGRYGLADAEPLTIALAARQLDLDRVERALRTTAAPGAPATRPPADWAGALTDHLAPLLAMLETPRGHRIDVAATLDIGTLVAGGALVRDVSAAFVSDATGVRVERAEALLPGDTTIDITGRIGSAFSGNVRASAAQPAILARWWTGAPFIGGAMAPIVAEADFDADAAGLEAPRLSLRVGQSSAAGRLAYRTATPDRAPSLTLALAAPRLDLADLADVWGILAAAGLEPGATPDVVVDLSAQEVLLGSTTGAALNFDASYANGLVTIDALSADDIAGARLFASGAIGDLFGTPVGVIEGTLVLWDGARLATALGSMGTPATEHLARLVPVLAPADLRFAVSGGGSGAGGGGLDLTLAGTAADTDLAGELSLGAPGPDWRAAPARLDLSARNDSAAALLAQAGLRVTAETPGAGALDIAFDGVPGDGMTGRATLDALGLTADFEGRLTVADALEPRGTFSLAADDIAGLATAFARALPDLGALTLAANVAPHDDGGVRLDALVGEIDGAAITGALTLGGDGLEGALAVEALDLGALVGWAMLGEDPMVAATWPSTTFGAALAPPFPLALSLSAERLGLGSLTVADATMALSLSADGLSLDDLDAAWAGGTLSGELDLTREGARADLSGALSLTGADLSRFVWGAEDGAPVATGRLSADGAFSASSYTVSGLVAGLGGEGTLRLANTHISGLNAAPLDALAGDPLPAPEAAATTVDAHLDAGALTVEDLAAALTLAGGAVRLDEVAIDTPAGPALANASVDLATGTLSGGVILTLTPPGTDGIAVDVNFTGPLAAPARTVDVSALAAWLNIKALERQVQAVEAQNEELEAEANRLDPALGTAPDAAAPARNAAAPPDEADEADGASAAQDAPDGVPLPPAPPPDQRSDAGPRDAAHRRHAARSGPMAEWPVAA